MRLFRILASSLPLIATVLVIPTPAASQTGTDDRGTFQVLVGGREVGTEEFLIQQTGTGTGAEIVATARVHLQLPTGSLDLGPRLRTNGLQAQPVAYEVSIGGTSPRRIVGTVADGRFSARIVTPTGEQLREYLASSGATVLDDGVAHHYYFLARRVRNGRVPIIIPRENRQVMATVTAQGEETLRVGDASVTAYRIIVRPDGGDERRIWVDALSRVIRVEIPARDYAAVRTSAPA